MVVKYRDKVPVLKLLQAMQGSRGSLHLTSVAASGSLPASWGNTGVHVSVDPQTWLDGQMDHIRYLTCCSTYLLTRGG